MTRNDDAYHACQADAAAEFPYVVNEGWPPEYDARVVELLRERRVPVSCDEQLRSTGGADQPGGDLGRLDPLARPQRGRRVLAWLLTAGL